MDKQQVRTLITRFYENNFPKELVLKFQNWFTRPENRDWKDEVLNELWEKETADANTLTLYGLEEINHKIKRNKEAVRVSLFQQILRLTAIFLLPVIGSVLTYWFMNNQYGLSAPVAEMVEYIVPDGEMKQITLPDGSEVWLNAGSVLLYSGDFSGPIRSLFLNGEARFQVEKDAERPFIVKTQYIQVEALGTVFNVKSYNQAGATEVTLEEGLVRVDVNGKIKASEVIHPNEQLLYDHRLAKTSKQSVDAALVAKWKEGYLVFMDASFEDIIRTIERRFMVTVNYDIRKYGGGSFSIKYAPYEDVLQVLTILKTLNPGMTWTTTENTVTIK